MDRQLRRLLEARFGPRLTGPVRQRHDETEIRIAAADVTEVLRTLHDEPSLRFTFLSDLCGVDTGVQGVCPGSETARIHLHRPGYGLRCAAGMRSGERPSRRLLPPGCVFMNTMAMMCAQRFANHT